MKIPPKVMERDSYLRKQKHTWEQVGEWAGKACALKAVACTLHLFQSVNCSGLAHACSAHYMKPWRGRASSLSANYFLLYVNLDVSFPVSALPATTPPE